MTRDLFELFLQHENNILKATTLNKKYSSL